MSIIEVLMENGNWRRREKATVQHSENNIKAEIMSWGPTAVCVLRNLLDPDT